MSRKMPMRKIRSALAETPRGGGQMEVFGTSVGIGNRPIVRNLASLFELFGQTLSPELAVHLEHSELYSIIHSTIALGAVVYSQTGIAGEGFFKPLNWASW